MNRRIRNFRKLEGLVSNMLLLMGERSLKYVMIFQEQQKTVDSPLVRVSCKTKTHNDATQIS